MLIKRIALLCFLLTIASIAVLDAADLVMKPPLAEFDAKALKWVRIAGPLLEQQTKLLEIKNSLIVVYDDGSEVVVAITTRERQANIGNFFGGPGYEVEISKADMRLLSAHYVR